MPLTHTDCPLGPHFTRTTSAQRSCRGWQGWVSACLLIASSTLSAQPGTGPGGVGNSTAPSDLKFWVKADAEAYSDIACTTPAADSGTVACWADQSGNGSDAQQSLVIRQPKWKTAILNSVHAQPVLRFDGVDDFLTSVAVPVTGALGRTLIAVITNGADSGFAYQHIAHYGSNGLGKAYGLCFRTNGNQTGGAGTNIGNHYWSLGFSSNLTQTAAPLILDVQYNGTQDELFANGSTQGTRIATLNTNNVDGIRLGSRINAVDGAEFFSGDIAELIAYGVQLTTPQRVLVENYLSSKYDIALTAQDKYAGDSAGNGDYDLQVAGIGRDSGSSSTQGVSAGLILTDNGFLQDNGDYLLAGHRVTTNVGVNSDLPVGVVARFQRIWYLHLTDVSNNGGGAKLTFDFATAGLGSIPGGGNAFHLLARAGTSGNFTSLATSTDVTGDQVTFTIANVQATLAGQGPYFTVGFTPSVDLRITKTDGASQAVAGQGVTYTIQASNLGTTNVTGATVGDNFPGTISGVSWTCSATAGSSCSSSGNGNLSDLVDLQAGGTVTYTATGTVSAAATGSLINTASVTTPIGVTDSVLSNNSATDTDTIAVQANLAISKTDGETLVNDGDTVIYTITVTNPSGPANAVGATVSDPFPAALTCSWTCSGNGGATCTAGPVAGAINDAVSLPVGGSVTYTATCAIALGTAGILTNTATAAMPAGTSDPQTSNNSASDVDLLRIVFADGFATGNLSRWSSAVGTSSLMLFELGGPRDQFAATFRLHSGDLARLARSGSELLSGHAESAELPLFHLEWRPAAAGPELRIALRDREGAWRTSDWLPAPTADRQLALTWQQDLQTGMGSLELAIDGASGLRVDAPAPGQQLQTLGIDRAAGKAVLWEDVDLE